MGASIPPEPPADQAVSQKHLRENDKARLRQEGWPEELIQRVDGKWWTADAPEVQALLGNIRRGGGMVITGYFDPNGPEKPYLRVREHVVVGKGKYKGPSGSGNRLYLSHSVDIEDASQALIITEGEKKAEVADYFGFPTISISGVWAWLDKRVPRPGKKTGPLLEWDLVSLENRKFYVVFDSDVVIKDGVKLAERDLRSELESRGAEVYIVRLPQPEGADRRLDGGKWALDSFLQNRGIEELQELIRLSELSLFERLQEQAAGFTETEDPDVVARLLRDASDLPPVHLDRIVGTLNTSTGIGRRALQQQLRQQRRRGDRQEAAAMKGEVFEDEEAGCYFIAGPEGRLQISSFRIKAQARVAIQNTEVISAEIHTDGDGITKAVFPLTAFHSKKLFLRSLPSSDFQWTGTDDNVQGVLRKLSQQELPSKRGTNVVGYLEEEGSRWWVTPDVVLEETGKVTTDIVYVPNGSPFSAKVSCPLSDQKKIEETAKEVLPAVLALNRREVILVPIGWFFATPFKPQINRILGHFPILMAWGTQGGGKTSMVRELWRMFGVRSEPYSAVKTHFSMIKLLSATNAIPIFIDEYKPYDMPKNRLLSLNRLIRQIYGGEVEERGRPDLSVETYELTAPVVIAGEARPSDPAIVERLVTCNPDKNSLQEPKYVQAFRKLRSLDSTVLAIPYVKFAMGVDTKKKLTEAEMELGKIISFLGNPSISIRMRDNLAITLFGMQMFADFAKQMGIEVEITKGDTTAAIREMLEDLADGVGGGKDPLDRFVEDLSVMAFEGDILNGYHYAKIDDLTCFHLPSCYSAYLEYRRRTGRGDETNGKRALCRLIRENCERDGYVKEVGKRVLLKKSRRTVIVIADGNAREEEHLLRTVALDVSQATETLDINEFSGAVRSHGGARQTSQDTSTTG